MTPERATWRHPYRLTAAVVLWWTIIALIVWQAIA